MRGLRKEGLSRGGKDWWGEEAWGASDARGRGVGVVGAGVLTLNLYPNCDSYHSPCPLPTPPYACVEGAEGLGSFSALYPTG